MSVPDPEPGLVLSYVYLWHREHRAGRDEGRKDRPSLIVLVIDQGAERAVTVLPITHSEPEPATAIEIPRAVKRHLGLDAERSWIILDEGNEFLWAGYDLRQIPKKGTYTYGFLPPAFFNQVVAGFVACQRAGKAKVVSRD